MLVESRHFAADAVTWSLPGGSPHISKRRRDWITELAFLRAFLALESFLEEAFVLYSLGHRAPKGRSPARIAFPPSRRAADEWVIPEGRPHASWSADAVARRAARFFKDGKPFDGALRASGSALTEARTIRNAVAHESISVQRPFEKLVRRKLGTVPINLTVGSFLSTTVPSSTPPESFLDYYLGKFDLVATEIVPPRT